MSTLVDNLEAFNRDLEKFIEDKMPEEVHAIQTQVALEALTRIVDKTPVDTGRTRANFQVTITRPSERVLGNKDKRGSSTINKGAAVIGGAPPFSLIWISNNVPHILVLEEGGFEPENPENTEEANKKRKSGRSKAQRRQAKALAGHAGAPLVKDGYSLQAPQGMMGITIGELRSIFG